MYMLKFRYPAYVTHSRYGICNIPDSLSICLKRYTIDSINIHNVISTIKDNRYLCILKNTIDHNPLNTNCITYIVKAEYLLLECELYTIYEDIPIKIYSILHTIGKTILGGDNVDFIILLYVL